jgi:hypothetical protein
MGFSLFDGRSDEEDGRNYNRPSTYREPERMLMIAMIKDAVDDIGNPPGVGGKAKYECRKDAMNWIFTPGENPDWILSFENVCDILELDPNYFREELLKKIGQLKVDGKWVEYHRRPPRTDIPDIPDTKFTHSYGECYNTGRCRECRVRWNYFRRISKKKAA